MKINKRDLILDSIIEAYLDENEPIGSAELMLRMEHPIAASTIRMYFRQLSDEGEIEQIHISSGRVPTILAMSKYWQKKIDSHERLIIKNSNILKSICDEFEIYCMIFSINDMVLREVLNYRDRFILIVFDKTEFILKFDIRVFKLLSNLIGSTLSNLENISSQVGLTSLKQMIRNFKNSNIKFIANEVIAFKIFENERYKLLLDPEFFNRFNENIILSPFFTDGFMGIKHEVIFDNEPATMVCAGSVYEDYENFFNKIMEAA